MSRQEQIVAVIRTAVPAFVGYLLALLISAIPAVGDWIAALDAQIAAALPDAGGVTVLGLLQAAAVALVVGGYYWVARRLGQRWPILERFLLGSSRQPVAYTPSVSARDDAGDITLSTVVLFGTVLAMLIVVFAAVAMVQAIALVG
jgi:hypothetical protein